MSVSPNDLDAMPPAVRRTVSFLRAADVWHILSRNHEARSCRDAVQKRNRLGHTGIPLCDEMKSFCGRYRTADGTAHLIAIHCRGDRLLDLEHLQRLLGADGPLVRLSSGDLERIGMDYGLVNPFGLAVIDDDAKYTIDPCLIRLPVLQLFDRDLLRPVGLPGSVMTNAGDLTWGVEFRPDQLVGALAHARVDEFTRPDPDAPPRPVGRDDGGIGILTGNSPESGMHLWRVMNDDVRRRLGADCLGDISMPRTVVHSVPAYGLSMELDDRCDAVRDALLTSVETICRSGIRCLAVACNTLNVFTPDIRRVCAPFGVRYLAIAEECARHLGREGVRDIALIGVRPVASLGRWSAYREPLADFRVDTVSDEGLEKIQHVAYEVKKLGPTGKSLNNLRDILRQETKAEHVLIALTELSLLIDLQGSKGKSGKTLIDTIDVYGKALAEAYLSGGAARAGAAQDANMSELS